MCKVRGRMRRWMGGCVRREVGCGGVGENSYTEMNQVPLIQCKAMVTCSGLTGSQKGSSAVSPT